MAQDNRHETIIEAAIKRFAHFGVSKTTLTEIANDVSLSKASLYYYFPDKLNLYAAVLKKITQTSATADYAELDSIKDPFTAIELYLEKRTEFIISFYNILEFLKTYKSAIPKELEHMFGYLKQRELKRLEIIIQKGVTSEIFKISDSKKIAALFFDFLEGYRLNSLTENKEFFPDKKQFRAMLKKELEFSLIFLRD